MKKVFVILVVLFVLGSGAVFAQVSDTAQLVLSGFVGDFVSITVTPTAAASNINLNLAQNNLVVGNAVEVANVLYDVSASSLNGFVFANGLGDTHGYDLSYGGETVAAGSGGTQSLFTGQTPTAGQNRSITITFPVATGIASGSYSDEITFTIEGP